MARLKTELPRTYDFELEIEEIAALIELLDNVKGATDADTVALDGLMDVFDDCYEARRFDTKFKVKGKPLTISGFSSTPISG